MKIALYIEDGLEQIVLTPQSEVERGIIGKLTDGSRQLSIKQGGFYSCAGGWARHKRDYGFSHYGDNRDDDSTIIILRPVDKTQPEKGDGPSFFLGPDPS